MVTQSNKRKQADEALSGLLRNAPAEVVKEIGPSDLVRMLEEGPADERERQALVSVLSGYQAGVRLFDLVSEGALSAIALRQVLTRLVENHDLGRAIPVRRDGNEWLEFAATLVDRAFSQELTDVGSSQAGRPRARSGRRNAKTTAERTREYEQSRRAEGDVRKMLWLTADAALALDQLVDAAGPGATRGSVASDAILAWKAKHPTPRNG